MSKVCFVQALALYEVGKAIECCKCPMKYNCKERRKK